MDDMKYSLEQAANELAVMDLIDLQMMHPLLWRATIAREYDDNEEDVAYLSLWRDKSGEFLVRVENAVGRPMTATIDVQSITSGGCKRLSMLVKGVGKSNSSRSRTFDKFEDAMRYAALIS